ncbi:hypothetical protein [Acidimangrovimonas sediminis]|uniref:hypothetical protein n=1 Tax=Acidimangrovimonas sediminis TaxID=2056283 RepID=UPI000C801B57|nr:hypothetical protein [Acidimangrovimonas sediminis]
MRRVPFAPAAPGGAGAGPAAGTFAAALLAALSLPADARAGGGALNGAAFDAYTRGKTLSYEVDGIRYGAERYLPGQAVVWAFDGQPCRTGHWFAARGHRICFVYEGGTADSAGPQCWRYTPRAGELRARYLGDGDAGAAERAASRINVRPAPVALDCTTRRSGRAAAVKDGAAPRVVRPGG